MLDDYIPKSCVCQAFFKNFLNFFEIRYFQTFLHNINGETEFLQIENNQKNMKKLLTFADVFDIIPFAVADVAHLVERHLAKVEVASSSLVIRSIKTTCSAGGFSILSRE